MSLICQNLIKTYRMGEVEVPALRGCSLTVEDGAFTMLTGASGCGKSTLLHCIAGVDRPDSGSIAIADTEITGLSVSDMAVFRRRSIGLIYQFFNLIPSLTILQNITLPLSLDGREPEREYFYALTNSLGIEGLLGRYPSQLSGGQQQRCAIARALMAKPAICLADEPTGNLDRKNTEEVIKLFREMKERFGQTILMVTHDSSLLGYGDRTVLMEDGLVISDVAARV